MRDYLFQPMRGAGPHEPVLQTLADDAAAIRHALSANFPNGCEVWEDYRLIGRFVGSPVHVRTA